MVLSSSLLMEKGFPDLHIAMSMCIVCLLLYVLMNFSFYCKDVLF